MKYKWCLVVVLLLIMVSAQAQTVDLAWDANPETDLAGYNIYRSTVSGSGYVKLNAGILTATTYSDISLIYGILYYFVCTAVNTSGLESDFSNEVFATVLNPNPPGVPTGLVVTQTSVGISVDWDDVPGAENYRVLLGRAVRGGAIRWVYRKSVLESEVDLDMPNKYKKYIYVGVQSVNSSGISAITYNKIG